MMLNRKDFNEGESGTLTAEISQLQPPYMPGPTVSIQLLDGDNMRTFDFTNTDTDGEDTYGWNYTERDTGKKLLIIND